MIFKTKKKTPLWTPQILFFIGILLVSSLGISFVEAVDADGDGLSSEIDNTDLILLTTPYIFTPKQRQAVFDENLNAIFSGKGEVGTTTRIFEGGAQQCTATVSGNGISFGRSASGTIDLETLIAEGVLAQWFYDTRQDSILSDTWRDNRGSGVTWYSETKDDGGDSICDYRTGDDDNGDDIINEIDDPRGGADDRCGEPAFPEQVLLITTTDTLFIFDAAMQKFWKSFAVSGITSLSANNGVVYAGTDSGLYIYDFVTDDLSEVLTTVSTPAIVDDTLTDVHAKTVGGKDYVVLGTGAGISIYNTTDELVVSKTTSSIDGASITSDDKLLYGIDGTTMISTLSIEELAGAWTEEEDISLNVNFESGTVNVVSEDFVGHSKGLTQISTGYADIENGMVYKETFGSLSGIADNLYIEGTVEGSPTVESNEITFDGSADFIALEPIEQTIKTVSFWVEASTITEDIMGLDGGTHFIKTIIGTLSAPGFVSPTIYIDGETSTMLDTNWHHVVVTTDTGVVASTPFIGKETDFFQGKMKDVRFYNRALSAEEVSSLFTNGGMYYRSYRHITPTYATHNILGTEKLLLLESEIDRSGEGNDCANNNGVVISAAEAGTEMQKFTFDGTSSYLSSGDTDFDITENTITVGMWIKRPTTGGTGPYQKLLSHGTSVETRNYFLSAGDNFFNYPLAYDPYFFGIRTDQGFQAASIQTTPVADTWEFIVGTYDGTNVRIYRNGVLEEVNSHTGNLVSVSEDLRIGYGYDDEYFEGSIALPFVATSAYTSDQIENLYNRTTAWFTGGSATTIQSASADIIDVVQDHLRNKAHILTSAGITALDTSTSIVTQASTQTGGTSIAPTYIGAWECNAFIEEGVHTVFARTYIGANASHITTSDRIFYIYESGTGDIDGDGLQNLYEDEEGNTIGFDQDNDDNVQIEQPVITSVIRDSEEAYTYTISGTGDPLWKGTTPSRVRIFILGEGETPYFAEVVEGTGTWEIESIPFEEKSYTLYARAYVGSNASNVDSEQVFLDVKNIVAGPPEVNLLPAYTGTNEVAFSWATNVLSAQFYAEISTNEDFSTVVQNSGWIPETSYTFKNLSDGQIYYFRVKLRDAESTETDFSEIVSTTIDTSAPDVGSIGSNGSYLATTGMEFSWTGFSDDGGSGVDHYELQIAENDDFSTIVYENNHYLGLNKSYIGTQGGRYFTRIKAVDGVALKSAFIHSTGTLIDTTAPEEFTLSQNPHPSPVGDQRISWTASSDEESGIELYEVYREDNVFNAQRILEPSMAMRVIGTTTDTSFIDSTTGDDEFYVYKIIAKNKSGIETETKTMQFHVTSEELYPPPLENTVSYATTDTVLLDWLPATDVGDINAYEVYRDGVLLHTTADGDTTMYSDTEAKTDGQTYQYKVRAKNALDMTGDFSITLSVLIDKEAPVTVKSLSGIANGNGWYNAPITATLEATDSISGVADILYNKNAMGLTPALSPITISTNGTNAFSFYATDEAGNAEIAQDIEIKMDTLSPIAQMASDLDVSTNNGFVTDNALDFTSTGTDAHSDVTSIVTYVRFDQNGDGALSGTNDFDFTQISTTATSPDTGTHYFTSDGLVGGIARDGSYTFKVVVTDNADNQKESLLYAVNIDRTSPVTTDDAPTAASPTTPFTLTLTPSDAPVSSGIESTYYTTDGTTPTTESTEGTSIASDDITFVGNYFTVKYFSVDNLGNSEEIKTATNQPTDTDSDGMPDWWEDLYGLDKNSDADATTDADSDTRQNLQEYESDTNPTEEDSDGDSISDGMEYDDGTDPNDSGDHRLIFLFPQTTTTLTTDTPFTFIAKAPVGMSVSVKNSAGVVIGTGDADASGRVAIELDVTRSVNHTISTEFIHTAGQLVETSGILIHVDGEGLNPVFGNLINDQLFIQGFIDLTMTGNPNARIEVFEIANGNLNLLTQNLTDGNGAATLTFPNTFIDGQILVLDQTNALTSQIIDVERGVFVSGQVFDENSSPLSGVVVKFIDGTTAYRTTTDSNGEYSLTVQGDKEYLLKIYHQAYLKDERTVQIERADLRISPILIGITDLTEIQGENGLIDVVASGKTNLRWSGMTRDALLKIAEKGYAFSLKQAKEAAEGIEEQIIMKKDDFGRDVFVGYKAGRLATDEYKVQPYIAQRVTGLLGAERRASTGDERYYTAAVNNEICLNKISTTAQFTDVSSRHTAASEIMEMHSYGVIQANKENKFLPNKTVTWDEVLQLVFAANCIQIEDYQTLKESRLPLIQDFSLKNELKSLLFYTALRGGIIDINIDPEKSPTRQDVLITMATVFDLSTNPKAVNVSYSDVVKTDPIAPFIVAAKQAGWFENFTSGRFFYHHKALTRGEFAVWFSGAVEYKKETLKPKNAFQRFISKFRGEAEVKNARLGNRETSRSDIETVLRAREYYKNEKKERLYLPTRNSWNPADPNTDRAPMEIHNPDASIKRLQKPGTFRESR